MILESIRVKVRLGYPLLIFRNLGPFFTSCHLQTMNCQILRINLESKIKQIIDDKIVVAPFLFHKNIKPYKYFIYFLQNFQF